MHLAGEQCIMQNSPAVWTLLSVDRYHQRWPKIPLTELQASGVQVRAADGSVQLVLLHKRCVSAAAARGEEPVYVCIDCPESVQKGTNLILAKAATCGHSSGCKWLPSPKSNYAPPACSMRLPPSLRRGSASLLSPTISGLDASIHCCGRPT